MDTMIYIGRFQPVHNAHVEILKRAASMAKQVIVVVGSANQPRTFKNPFTSAEREGMIKNVWKDCGLKADLRVVHVEDRPYNDLAWIAALQKAVDTWRWSSGKIGIIGHKKDASSFYLDFFPQWEHIEQPLTEMLHASDIRDLYFDYTKTQGLIGGVVPLAVIKFLSDFKQTEAYSIVAEEMRFLSEYKKQFANLPYPPVFVTTDAVIIQSGHVLMVERGAQPGKGLLALPGGFLNVETDKSVLDGCIREVYEETGLKVAEKVLRGSLVATRTFDAIGRSQRGRTITHAHKFLLNDGYALPKVKGSDDAAKAMWLPFAAVERKYCFEDHHDIVQWAIGG